MLFINSIGYWPVVYSSTVAASCRRHLDLHLLQVLVGGVFVAVVLHLAEVAFLRRQHGVNLGVWGGSQSTDLNNNSTPEGKSGFMWLVCSCLRFTLLTHLHDAMADGTVLSLPQKHQTDHNHSRYGDCNHQQANQRAAPEAEVLSQGVVGLLPSILEVRN